MQIVQLRAAQHLTRQLGDEVALFHGHDRAADLIPVQGLGSTHLTPHQRQRLGFHGVFVNGNPALTGWVCPKRHTRRSACHSVYRLYSGS